MGVHSNSPRQNVGSTVIIQVSTRADDAQTLMRSSSWPSEAITIAGSGDDLMSHT